MLGPEPFDVLHEKLGLVHLVRGGLDLIEALQSLHPVRGEDGRHRLNGSEFVADRLEILRLQYAGLHRGRIGIVGVGIPATELEIVEVGERNEVLDHGVSLLGALSETDMTHLRQRTNRDGVPLADGQNPGVERRGHRSHAWRKDSEFSGGRHRSWRVLASDFLRLAVFGSAMPALHWA